VTDMLACHKCVPSTLSLYEQHAGEDGNNSSPTLEKLRKARVYNEAAVLTGRQGQNGAYRDNNIQAQLRTTLVFVKHQGRGQLASLQLSNIGKDFFSRSQFPISREVFS
jgi:hypothetical protein